MRLAYLTHYDARDRRNYAGTPFYMAKALAEVPVVKLDFIGPLRERNALPTKFLKLLYLTTTSRDYLRVYAPSILRGYAQQAAPILDRMRPDVVVSPTSLALAHLHADTSLVLWSDATFAAMAGFYPGFKNLSARSWRDGEQMERGVLDRCALAVYSSEWAARSAVEHYGCDPARVHVIPYGANLDDEPTADDVAAWIAARPTDRCRLLHIGVQWERKGGPKAVEVAQALNDAGLPTELTVIGCEPPGPLPPFVRVLGFIPKSTPEGRHRLRQAWAESHFLILPSEADCTPIVLCEACAFGVPCLASEVGGIPTTIREDRNGATFPLAAQAAAYRDYVLDRFADPARYDALAHSARTEYQDRLNWPVAVRSLLSLIDTHGLAEGRHDG